MPGPVTHLDRVEAADDPRPPSVDAPADHPMRRLTEEVAADPGTWDAGRRQEVAGFFDALAPEWHTRGAPGRDAPLRDAFARGVPPDLRGPAAEVGSGTGLTLATVAARFVPTLAVEVSPEMLRRSPPAPAHRVLADGARLPAADGALAAVVLMNAFLFGPECDRVLAPDGVVVWVNSRGPATPIHLPAEAVLDALPGAWAGRAGEHHSATWCVAHRTDRA